MVMFKAKFRPTADRPPASAGGQQQQQQPEPERKAPPVEKERGPQAPVKLPGPSNPPERAR